jgi:NADH:ubiquinone oxidoreductase subunit F (NADH-binding)
LNQTFVDAAYGLTSDQLDVRLDPESLKSAGSSLGCGVMKFYPQGTCMVEATLGIAQFFARESCGQCPACRMETNLLAMMLVKISSANGDASLYGQFQNIVDFNRGKGYPEYLIRCEDGRFPSRGRGGRKQPTPDVEDI